jgi:Transposase DNA-binding/Transposase DDE domain
MTYETLQNEAAWAEAQWGRVELGDVRRTARAIKVGEKLAGLPSGSLPQQQGNWGDVKAAYRLLNEGDVTFEGLSGVHWQGSLEAAKRQAGVVLFIQDGSELNYSKHQATTGLGHIGNGKGQGFQLHSCLAVAAERETVLGLVRQQVWVRESLVRDRQARGEKIVRTEGEVWASSLEEVGAVPEAMQKRWVSVGDRNSDIFSYLKRAKALSWECLVRVSKDRQVVLAGEKTKLVQGLRSLEAQTTTRLSQRGRGGQAKREVKLKVAWSAITLLPPVREKESEPIQGYCLRVWEDKQGNDAIEWLLFTTLPISSDEQALRYIHWYSLRWLIEEYHKALKTGCAIEQRQLTSAHALKNILAFLAIVAVRLLQLRCLARSQPMQPATEHVDPTMLGLVATKFKLNPTAMTLKTFWHSVAHLGGFLARKSDGDPGWQTLWKGWLRLQDMAWAISTVGATCI